MYDFLISKILLDIDIKKKKIKEIFLIQNKQLYAYGPKEYLHMHVLRTRMYSEMHVGEYTNVRYTSGSLSVSYLCIDMMDGRREINNVIRSLIRTCMYNVTVQSLLIKLGLSRSL